MKRDLRIDNIRFILIYCVVFGHFLEQFEFQGLYRVIYSFHIPAFIFIAGYFAKFDRKKIVFSLSMMYFVFQAAYIVFQTKFILEGSVPTVFQWTSPFWILWFLLALIFYYILIPMFEVKEQRVKIMIFTGTLFLGLLAGYDDSVGYLMSLSRFFTFLPYFVAGFYLKQGSEKRFIDWLSVSRWRFIMKILNIGIVLISIIYFYFNNSFIQDILYGSYSYSALGYGPIMKLLLYIIGFQWIFLFFWATPNVRIPILTKTGQYTLSVFMLHGFIMQWFYKEQIFRYSLKINLIISALLSLFIVVLLGNRYVGNLFNVAFGGKLKVFRK